MDGRSTAGMWGVSWGMFAISSSPLTCWCRRLGIFAKEQLVQSANNGSDIKIHKTHAMCKTWIQFGQVNSFSQNQFFGVVFSMHSFKKPPGFARAMMAPKNSSRYVSSSCIRKNYCLKSPLNQLLTKSLNQNIARDGKSCSFRSFFENRCSPTTTIQVVINGVIKL